MTRTKNFYTTFEAAKALGVSVRTAQQWLERGILSGWKTEGKHRRISSKSVDLARQLQLPKKGVAAPDQSGLRILIVEDDAALLRLYRVQLARWPFSVEIFSAPNGFEGLVMVGEVAPHLLICDLRLPGVNGFHIVRALHNMPRYRDMKVVVVSGLPSEEIDANGGLFPGVELMNKPIDFNRLQTLAASLPQNSAV